jgi:hypothetical protein
MAEEALPFVFDLPEDRVSFSAPLCLRLFKLLPCYWYVELRALVVGYLKSHASLDKIFQALSLSSLLLIEAVLAQLADHPSQALCLTPCSSSSSEPLRRCKKLVRSWLVA